MRILFTGFVSLMLGLAFVSSSQALTRDVVGGQLLGASGVIVNGVSYDVQFLDGTCAALFSGCDADSDFDFPNQAVANAAAQALLDQVFLDVAAGMFDSDPSLTNGCTNTSNCTSHIPYSAPFQHVVALNYFPLSISPDQTGTNAVNPNNDLTTVINWNFAKFTQSQVSPVPIPAIFPIFAAVMGLFGIVGWRRRRRAAAVA